MYKGWSINLHINDLTLSPIHVGRIKILTNVRRIWTCADNDDLMIAPYRKCFGGNLLECDNTVN